MTITCAWCGLTIKLGDTEVSHGICENCAIKLINELNLEIDSDIEELDD